MERVLLVVLVAPMESAHFQKDKGHSRTPIASQVEANQTPEAVLPDSLANPLAEQEDFALDFASTGQGEVALNDFVGDLVVHLVAVVIELFDLVSGVVAWALSSAAAPVVIAVKGDIEVGYSEGHLRHLSVAAN